jgi:hypothetical protein
MVTSSITLALLLAGNLLAAEATRPVLERLDPPRRAAVVMALLALVLTGLLMVACAMLGAHWVRRMARHRPARVRSRVAVDSIGNQRVREALHEILPMLKSDDTVHIDPSTKETKVDP